MLPITVYREENKSKLCEDWPYATDAWTSFCSMQLEADMYYVNLNDSGMSCRYMARV